MRIPKALSISLGMGILGSTLLHAGYEVFKGHLFGRVTTGAEADSNIYLNSHSTGDFIVTVVPEVDFKRDVALVLIDMSAGLRVMRFIDQTANNDANPFASTRISWTSEAGKSGGQVLASATQVAQANQDVNLRTVSDNYLLDGSFGHFPTEKFGYRFGSRYSDEDYSTPGLSDVQVIQAGLDVRHQYSPKLESFFGYNFRESTTRHRRPDAVSIDSLDHQVMLGLDGELLPKVKGRVAAGTVTRRFARTNRSETGLLLNSSVDWKWKENIAATFNALHDYDMSPGDQSITRSSLALGARIQMKAKIVLSGEGRYSHDNYNGGALPRVDRTYSLDARCVCSFTPRIQGRAYVSYRTIDSTSAFSTYNQVIAGVSVGVKL